MSLYRTLSIRSRALLSQSTNSSNSVAFLHQWPSTSALVCSLGNLLVNKELEGVDWRNRERSVIGQNFHLLGSRRFGFPKGTKPKPRYEWDFDDLEKQTQGKYTHKPLIVKKLGGRNPETGKKVNQHIGGGVKFDYFLIDKQRKGPQTQGSFYEERVLEVRRDPNRTAFIALVAGTKGKRRIIASENMQAGQIIKTTQYIPPNPVRGEEGNAYPVGSLVVGTVIHCVEKLPGHGAQLMVQAGAAATISKRHEELIIIQMPNKKEFALKPECMCVVGRASNPGWKNLTWGSGEMHRRFGYRPSSGLWHRKTGYDGRKIRALGPPIVPDENNLPVPQENYKVTLYKKDLCGLFGTAVNDRIGRGTG